MGPSPEDRARLRGNSPNLDILRAIAVLTVVVDHLVPGLVSTGHAVPVRVHDLTKHLGHSGVLAFFVHTSLVLMYSLERVAAPTRWVQVKHFYVRRFFRIYPLAIVAVLAMVALGWPAAIWKATHANTWQEIAANLLLVQNLWTGHSVLIPLWSLPYEVEMYLVLPLTFWIARRPDGLRWLLGLLVLSMLGGYVFRKLQHGHMNLAAYVPCFLAGVCCYVARDRVAPRLPGWSWPLFVLAAVGAYAWMQAEFDRLVYWYGWVYAIAIAVAIPLFPDSRVRWLNRAAAQVATYSYGIYLLHAPALYLVFLVWDPDSVALSVAMFLALTAALAVLAYHLVEAPLVRLGRRLSS